MSFLEHFLRCFHPLKLLPPATNLKFQAYNAKEEMALQRFMKNDVGKVNGQDKRAKSNLTYETCWQANKQRINYRNDKFHPHGRFFSKDKRTFFTVAMNERIFFLSKLRAMKHHP